MDVDYKNMLEQAGQAGACPEALNELEKFSSFEDAVKNCKSAHNYLCWYAEYVLEGRWKAAEKYIMKDPEYAYLYSSVILHGRWKAAEKYIMKSSEYAYRYSAFVIEGRWPEAEKYILKDNYYAQCYKSIFNIKGRAFMIKWALRRWAHLLGRRFKFLF